MKTKKKYIAPSVERFLYQAEEGFALSQVLGFESWTWFDNDQENHFDENGDGSGTDWKWDD